MPKFYKWTDIEQFHNTWKTMKYFVNREASGAHEDNTEAFYSIRYRAKVKLHGTNSSIQLHPDGTAVFQSRSRVVSYERDNYGFATWAMEFVKQFDWKGPDILVLDGEWIGPGIQKGVSAGEIPSKAFCIFALRLIDEETETTKIVTEPSLIGMELAYTKKQEGLPYYIIPWYKKEHGEYLEIEVDTTDPDRTQIEVNKVNMHVNRVEEEDPFIASTFGVAGTGEGLVLYPVLTKSIGNNTLTNVSVWSDYETVTRYLFKAKGEKHSVVKQKAPVIMSAEKASSIRDFVERTVTEQRLQQGFTEELDGVADIKKTGSFIKWVNQDVLKECKEELATAGLEWKKVTPEVSRKAREWLIKKVTEVG